MERWIASVGIDVGTSTTKWIRSRLKLVRSSGASALPRYEIAERRIEYESPLYATPLTEEDAIDPAALTALLEREYANAGLLPEAVETGAVIITGETAARRNAREVLHRLARLSGQLVAAAAGAELEALLAGFGSGARRRSLETEGIIANVDIGGGTANAVYFLRGERIATATFHIGGRLVRLDAQGRVLYAADALRRWDAAAGLGGAVPAAGDAVSFTQLRALCERLAGTLIACVCGDSAAMAEAAELSVGPPAVSLPLPQEILISGGVGALMGEPAPAAIAETARYGDMGPLLAAALAGLAASSADGGVPVRAADHPARATVIGAGAYSLEVSGATVYYSDGLLPLRNVPVVVCRIPAEEADSVCGDQPQVEEVVGLAVNRGVQLYGEAGGGTPFALAVRTAGYCSYRRLQRLAAAIAAGYAAAVPDAAAPLVIICESDLAKALAYSLLGRLGGGEGPQQRRKLVCLDQLAPCEGEYIDIGVPMKEDMVPVVIKSLVFGG
ncbi:MAG: hypothetical protein K0R57_5059 [Paenibacillaceae bacterium]|jgi:ethanolamine utilization protein EutA|nr:hypothetical protein [Paenibacillaceae bacterium]